MLVAFVVAALFGLGALVLASSGKASFFADTEMGNPSLVVHISFAVFVVFVVVSAYPVVRGALWMKYAEYFSSCGCEQRIFHHDYCSCLQVSPSFVCACCCLWNPPLKRIPWPFRQWRIDLTQRHVWKKPEWAKKNEKETASGKEKGSEWKGNA